MRRTRMGLVALAVAVALTTALPAAACAAEKKPLVVVSFAGYDELKADIAYVGRLSDNPDLAVGLEAMLKLFTHSRGLDGLDKTRPWGAVIDLHEKEPAGCAFVPVSDAGRLLEVAEMLLGPAEELDGGVYKLSTDDGPLYVKQSGKWAVAAKKQEHLGMAPKRPMALVGELSQLYDVAVRFNVDRVPDRLRQKFRDDLREDIEEDLRRKPSEDDLERQVRERIARTVLDVATHVTGETEAVTLGWNLDHGAEQAFFDIAVTALPGTKMAEQMDALGETETRFAGFVLPEATLVARWTAQCVFVDAERVRALGGALERKIVEKIDEKDKPDEEKEIARQITGKLLATASATLASGRADGAFSVRLTPDAATMVCGKYLAKGENVEQAVEQLAEIVAAEHPCWGDRINIDAGTYQGVRLHTAQVPIPEHEKHREKIVAMVGEKLEVVLGFGDDAVFLAAGRDAMTTLKKAIHESREKDHAAVSPLNVSLSLGSLARFVAEVGESDDERQRAEKVAELLKDHVGRDKLQLSALPIERGVRLRFQLDEGILRLMGKAATTP